MYFTRNIYECNICIYHTACAVLFARNIIMVVTCLSLKKVLPTKIEEERRIGERHFAKRNRLPSRGIEE